MDREELWKERLRLRLRLRMYKSFEEMPVWQKAMDLSVEVFNLTTSLPRSEDYGLTSQIRRATNSISANIACPVK